MRKAKGKLGFWERLENKKKPQLRETEINMRTTRMAKSEEQDFPVLLG